MCLGPRAGLGCVPLQHRPCMVLHANQEMLPTREGCPSARYWHALTRFTCCLLGYRAEQRGGMTGWLGNAQALTVLEVEWAWPNIATCHRSQNYRDIGNARGTVHRAKNCEFGVDWARLNIPACHRSQNYRDISNARGTVH
ncbi:hypothetical protein E2562_038402 [Oryza meyeriana var. granulata]|uniref:Uncharacterized protein n=1 Tax=Oryza meyeriana var. granulata TaxID=110450 RepID=A0A6G1E9D0_9ORYZ|nr:hypothetical protein E2562_038402 [Oryza meyeriana var. granulata]